VASITTDIVDAYVFRHRLGRAQFLLLRRREGLPLGGTWHGVHGRVSDGETSLEAALRAVRIQTGLAVRIQTGLATLDAYSADYINQFFDHATDTIVLAPVFAFQLVEDTPIALDDEFDDYAWCDRDEATGRLIFAGQRWAVRHIEDIVANPVADSDFYRLT
jgi:dATP pyrophosphohydrolase